VTSANYLSVLQKKPINKVVANNIKETQVKEEEKKARKVVNAQGIAMRTIQKTTNNIAKAKFIVAWSTIVVSRIRDWFH
jgi:hypothetical protein